MMHSQKMSVFFDVQEIYYLSQYLPVHLELKNKYRDHKS